MHNFRLFRHVGFYGNTSNDLARAITSLGLSGQARALLMRNQRVRLLVWCLKDYGLSVNGRETAPSEGETGQTALNG